MQKRGRFDYILLETTGFADPGRPSPSFFVKDAANQFWIGPIASMFWDNEGMSDMMRLDSVICVVDGIFAFNVSLFHDTAAICHLRMIHEE